MGGPLEVVFVGSGLGAPIVDSSVLVAALVDTGPNGTWAEEVVSGGSLHAPELARVEATKLLRRLELAKQLTTAEANAAHDDLMQRDMELFPFDPFADRIWELRHTVTSYDAWYAAVAEVLRLPLAHVAGATEEASGAAHFKR